MANKILSIVAALGVIAVAISKFLAGEAPNYTEVTLAVAAILAALGFQRSA